MGSNLKVGRFLAALDAVHDHINELTIGLVFELLDGALRELSGSSPNSMFVYRPAKTLRLQGLVSSAAADGQSMNVPPLSHLRRKPGRPRKLQPSASNWGIQAQHQEAHTPERSERRLLDLAQTARYLGVSAWTIRDLEARGVLTRVYVPLPGGRELRKLLFDKAELDRLIETRKEAAVLRV